MRLDRIRVAGFKSFVDPTTIPLPGNLVGIVGPNGCGKSNIIDAVRWVMGESSAKHLRGESMADVIFNGSASRKPVGVASVELVFDNADESAPGAYAQYREISIKRQVSRDGQSTYFLNGSRCRRKDITDLFLGTGLGARSYAIIEQGTISRLIEAKPDELRSVIEEAAGISKYKERRNDTENRMRHTAENLERLQDLRDEVSKQLAHLQRQARKAEKYTALKEDERRFRRELLALRWRRYDQILQTHREGLRASEERFRQLFTEDSELAQAIDTARTRHDDLQKSLQGCQAEFYEVGAEVSRLEQALKHAKKTREDLLKERERLQSESIRADGELEADREQLAELREELTGLEDAFLEACEDEQSAQLAKQAADQALRSDRGTQDTLKLDLARQRGQIDLQTSRLRQLDDQRRQLDIRTERLTSERNELDDLLFDEEMENLREELAAAEAERDRLQQRLDSLTQTAQQERSRIRSLLTELNGIRSEVHSLEGKISSLERLQQHAMGKDRSTLKSWLERNGLSRASRLAEHLEVQPGWEAAVEAALGLHLEAICVDNVHAYLDELDAQAINDSLALFEMRSGSDATAASGGRLLERVRAPWPLDSLLGDVICAENAEHAKDLAGSLGPNESVITADGLRLGPGWLARQKTEDGKAGVLSRERELRELKQRREEGQERIGAFEQTMAQAEEAVRQAEFERDQRQSELNRTNAEITRLKSELSALSARSDQARRRLSQLEFELEDLEQSRLQNAEEAAEAGDSLNEAQLAAESLEARFANAALGLEERELAVAAADDAWRAARDRVHQLKSRIGTLQSNESLTLRQLERLEQQTRDTRARLDELAQRMEDAGAPMDDDQERLETLIEQRLNAERALSDQRKRVSEVETEIRTLSERRLVKERELDALKRSLEQVKLDYSANEVRRQTVEEQFQEIDTTPDEVLPNLPAEAEENEWQRQLTQLGEEIGRLGAINLTAMDEFREQSERAEFLDRQYQDLTDAQNALTEAIEKIDRECRARFKETFDRVNSGFQRMFPKLFGGGQAYLEMSERDLLEAGVSVMARPPGKRNSSIHLLSGGEKALTAVALVFSIFELNPAPFCLLDEVDAPLDDANVGRFSQLVKEMSEKVQFLFISHNKATMEIAQHLAGVTMKEPGVSRIVAVDIDEAVELAAV